MIEIAYRKYLDLPLASVTGDPPSEIYDKGWCVLTGLSYMHPHPHRYYTLEEFSREYLLDMGLRERFPISIEEYEVWREKEIIEQEARGVITPRLYKTLHENCPECKGNAYITTLVAPAYIFGQDYEDKINIVRCNCGWTGTPHDLIPSKK